MCLLKHLTENAAELQDEVCDSPVGLASLAWAGNLVVADPWEDLQAEDLLL